MTDKSEPPPSGGSAGKRPSFTSVSGHHHFKSLSPNAKSEPFPPNARLQRAVSAAFPCLSELVPFVWVDRPEPDADGTRVTLGIVALWPPEAYELGPDCRAQILAIYRRNVEPLLRVAISDRGLEYAGVSI